MDKCDRRLVAWEEALISYRLSHLAIELLESVGGVDELANFRRDGEGRNYFGLEPVPARGQCRALPPPLALLEICQGLFGGFSAVGRVDRPQSLSQCLTLLPGSELHRVANQVHDA